MRKNVTIDTQPKQERAILVGLLDQTRARKPGPDPDDDQLGPDPDEASLEELDLLAQTAGSAIVGRLQQRRRQIHPATFLGKGKLEELRQLREESDASVIIFDEDLAPAQARNLEEALECKIIDRTELILDIFATRARTREAQVQVELAQLQYLLPRLTRMWTHLSRQEGGIGMRGPGETQLEVDRRRVGQRVAMLKKRLEVVERERETQSRRRGSLFRTSFVGYTNAGKSTLFNALTRAGVLEEDQLFATLDTTTRRLGLENGQVVLLSDTVGFIRKLPHHLIASFRATLGEVREADLLIHVVDASHAAYRRQMRAVDEVIEGLMDGREVPILLVLNKADCITEEDALGLQRAFPDAMVLSAHDRGQALTIKAHLITAARDRFASGTGT